jgi:polar amino acid transport system permease protein
VRGPAKSSSPNKPIAMPAGFGRGGKAVWSALLVFVLVSAVFVFAFQNLAYDWNWGGIWKYRQLFINGWLNTVVISCAALVLSSVIGVLAALGGRSAFLPLRYLVRTYVEVVRCTPLLVQILILFYGVAQGLNLDFGRYLSGILILSFFSGAYISEIVRAGIEGVSKSLWESSRAIGLTVPQTYRHIIFPLAFRQSLPPLAGQFVSLIKDSSLLSVIAINELTLNAQQVQSFTLNPFESYLPLAAGYLVLTLPISIWTRSLERKFHYET